MPSITALPGLDCAGLIHWLLFVRTFWTYMNSDSCCANAGGSVVPHGPWKWCLGNITRKLRVDDATPAFDLQLFWKCIFASWRFSADLREVFRFRGCFRVEFCHWNAPGGNQGPEHGGWVDDGGGAHLQVNREPRKTCGKCLIGKRENGRMCIWEPTTRQRSQTSISFSTLVRMWESIVSPKNTMLGLSRPLQSLLSHLNSSGKNSTPVSNYILPK